MPIFTAVGEEALFRCHSNELSFLCKVGRWGRLWMFSCDSPEQSMYCVSYLCHGLLPNRDVIVAQVNSFHHRGRIRVQNNSAIKKQQINTTSNQNILLNPPTLHRRFRRRPASQCPSSRAPPASRRSSSGSS